MYRVIKMSGNFYAVKIRNLEAEEENIEILTNEGTPVILVSNLDDLEALGIEPSEVEEVF